MILRILRHAALPALAAAIVVGCSSKQAPADAFVASSIQAAAAGVCPSFQSQTTWIDVGVPTGTQPTTISDSGSQAGAQVNVSCTVHAESGGFDIDLEVEVYGEGSIHIVSNAPGAVTASGASGVTGNFVKALGSSSQGFRSDNCTIAFTYRNQPVPNSSPIAPGRIWAHLSCVDAQGLESVLTDAGSAPETCDTEADFLFENCNE